MSKGTIRTTTFRVENGLSKGEQERLVGEAFRQAYGLETGITLEGNRPVELDPPDRIFSCQGLTVGAELFELERLYTSRAFVELLTNEVYLELERRGLINGYAGITAQLVSNLKMSTKGDVKSQWGQRGIKKNPANAFAVEFVDLFINTVDSREALPNRPPGIVLPIDPRKYPALSAVGELMTISKCPSEDIRRSDGQSSPLVILGGVIECTDEEIEQSIQQQIRTKIIRRPEWHGTVDRAVLIAHDLPRDRYYLVVRRDWGNLIESAAGRANVLETFDELWLVTCRNLTLEALRICGRSLETPA